MKILSFHAEKLHGYQDGLIDIKFNHDVNFIYGANGCGKTTILRLIQAVLSI